MTEETPTTIPNLANDTDLLIITNSYGTNYVTSTSLFQDFPSIRAICLKLSF